MELIVTHGNNPMHSLKTFSNALIEDYLASDLGIDYIIYSMTSTLTTTIFLHYSLHLPLKWL